MRREAAFRQGGLSVRKDCNADGTNLDTASTRDRLDEPDCITQTELLELAVGIHAAQRRYLIGFTGPPGSGKSTLAAYLAKLLLPSPPVVPMDGFHLSQALIDSKGLASRKGSPETFDPWGFANLVARLARSADEGVLYAPAFDRDIEEPIAGAIPVRPADGLVIVEGNYLLFGEPPWAQIRPALDLCAYLELDDATRRSRLIERHMRYGKTRLEAERFVRNSDEKNTRLVKPTRNRADLIVRPG